MPHRMTLEQFSTTRRLFGLDEPTLLLLKAFHRKVEPRLDKVVEEFGDVLWGDDRASGIMARANGDITHWRQSLRAWLDSMLVGPHDNEAYLSTRFRIGDRHAEAELPQDLVLSAMAQIRQNLLRLAFELETFEDSREALALAICRVIDLEVALLLQSYRYRLLDRLMVTERLSTIGQLVASIGHELRNPLSTIETSAYLLLQKLVRQGEGTVDAQVTRHLERIRHQVRVATKTVSDLLELAKNRPPRRQPLFLRALVEASLDGVRAPDAVSLVLDVGDDMVVHADADQLRIVLVNLISNAFDAVGGRGNVVISAAASQGGVSLWVTDDGPGISLPVRDQVFQALFTTKPNGNGLGLPLCRRIAEAHGGHLRLEPTSKGASFRLWLPGPESSSKPIG